MDHVVYLDYKSQELEKILSWEKNMLIRGATWRKLPYWKVELWDILYFINNNAEGLIKAKATVSSIFNSEKMNENESKKLENDNMKEQKIRKSIGKSGMHTFSKENRDLPVATTLIIFLWFSSFNVKKSVSLSLFLSLCKVPSRSVTTILIFCVIYVQRVSGIIGLLLVFLSTIKYFH